MFKNKSFRKAILTFQNVRHCAFCKAKKMTWYGMIIKWLQLKKILLSFFLKERLLFCCSTPLLMTVKDQQTKKTFRFHMATGDFTTILCSLIMSLGCITEENRKENNTNTEALPAMWCPCICNSKNSSNSCKSFHKDFLERVRKEADPPTSYTRTL